MSISIRNIPNYEDLLEYIPESQYTRNAVTSARRNTKLNATTPIVGGNFTPSLEAEFRIAASQSCLLNLAECYFTIAGELSKKVDLPLRAGPLWILKCMNKVALSIGGTNVYTIQTPALLAKYREIFAQSVHDIRDGSLEQEGYPRDADAPHDLYHAAIQVNPAGGGAAANYGNPGTVFYDKGANTGFTVTLKLADLFPIENMKPIFGQDVKVYITFDSAGFTGIIDGKGQSPTVTKFSQFFLNTITYTINVDMIAKLNNVYAKQVVEIIDDVNYNFQGVTSLGGDQQVDIYIPLQTQFETDMIYIAMPHAISNNAFSGITLDQIGKQKPQTANFVAHTPMDYRFMDIRRIVVEADGEILYMRTYDEVKSADNAGLTMASPVGSVLIKNVKSGGDSKITASDASYQLYDFTTAYNDYKECRYYHGVIEEKCQPFEDWMFSGFGIAIPVRAFSRLTTGSNLRISINFGSGMSADGNHLEAGADKTSNVYVNSFFTSNIVESDRDAQGQVNADADKVRAANWIPLKNLLVIQKSSKALVFNGFNNCAIKNITQSFEQDIVVENKEADATAPQ